MPSTIKAQNVLVADGWPLMRPVRLVYWSVTYQNTIIMTYSVQENLKILPIKKLLACV